MAVLLLSFVTLVLGQGAASAKTPNELPKRFQRSPYSLMSLSVGYPNDGFQVRAKKLRKTPDLKIKNGSRGRSYGHPALVLMLKRSAADVAKAVPDSVMLVGDLSRKHGGPLSGHVSHQSGRDADVGFYVVNSRGRSYLPSRFISFDGEGNARDGSGLKFDDRRNWLLVQSWARDRRAGLAHVFVSSPLRARLMRYAQRYSRHRKYIPAVQALMKQPEASSTHDDHFHVRIACPNRHEGLCYPASR
jgi:penicillin-insensitive murein endopeptidase